MKFFLAVTALILSVAVLVYLEHDVLAEKVFWLAIFLYCIYKVFRHFRNMGNNRSDKTFEVERNNLRKSNG